MLVAGGLGERLGYNGIKVEHVKLSCGWFRNCSNFVFIRQNVQNLLRLD